MAPVGWNRTTLCGEVVLVSRLHEYEDGPEAVWFHVRVVERVIRRGVEVDVHQTFICKATGKLARDVVVRVRVGCIVIAEGSMVHRLKDGGRSHWNLICGHRVGAVSVIAEPTGKPGHAIQDEPSDSDSLSFT